jgi:hypothetical protein
MDSDPDPGGPKTWGPYGSGSGSLTLGFGNTDAAEEGRRWQEAELRRKDETFAAAEEKHRRQVLNIRILLDFNLVYHDSKCFWVCTGMFGTDPNRKGLLGKPPAVKQFLSYKSQ